MIVIKEEFVGGEKWNRAIRLGKAEAIQLWLALKAYCAAHPELEGFVAADSVGDLPGAPARTTKALTALVDCGRVARDGTRGAGLLDAVAGGWQLHDYLDHAASGPEVALRRERARNKKRAQREAAAAALRLEMSRGVPGTRGDLSRGQSPGQVGTASSGVPRVVVGDGPRDSRGRGGARVPTPPQPTPTQPDDEIPPALVV